MLEKLCWMRMICPIGVDVSDIEDDYEAFDSSDSEEGTDEDVEATFTENPSFFELRPVIIKHY